MSQKSQCTKALITMLALALFSTACTKTRNATLPDEAQDSIFAISEVETESAHIQTDSQLTELSLGNSAKATAEKGIVAVADAEVPPRLKFMFKGLEVSGIAQRSYPIAISVDKQFVTAYKVVGDVAELTTIEKELAQVKDEVAIQKQLQKAKDPAQAKTLMATLKKVRDSKQLLMTRKTNNLLVPLFKYKIKSYGVLQKVKNELNEETSKLRLKTTDWSEATHIELAITSADRLNVGLDPATRGDLDRTFVMDRINNKIMTAETLSAEYQIPVNLEKSTHVLTLLDADAIHIFEIGKLGKTILTDSQMQQLKSGSNTANVRKCSAEIEKALPADAQKDCILVLRYDVAVTYVRPELPMVDYDGNRDAKLQFKTVRAADSIGLVQIAPDAQPKKVESNNELDPRTSLRIVDIKNKEFFFRRTLEDTPETIPLEAGSTGALTIVKFDLEESRLVVRKADRLVEYKGGSNDFSYEEVMSIPVTYLKRETKDASGATYAISRMVKTTRQDAEYVDLDWTKNTMSADYSPYSTISKSCINAVADTKVTDVDMRLDKGTLSFSFDYSVGLSESCITPYTTNDYNGLPSYQTTAKLKERVSFKVNDGTSDKSFVGQIPFRVQNELGYGVWTIGKLKPNASGSIGHEGQEESLSVVQDFRDGKKLVYTVTGLENRQGEIDPEIRQMYIETIQEVVNGWDFAYKQAFKGTKFERAGRYVEVQIAGENGIEAHVGDLDKNIIHFENKVNDNSGGLGVSQVGYNPRSGIVVADSLIIYAGNLQNWIDGYQTNMKRTQEWTDKKAMLRQQALAKLAAQQKEATDKAGAAAPEQAAGSIAQLTKRMLKSPRPQSLDKIAHDTLNRLNLAQSKVIAMVNQQKSLGGKGAFKYGSNDQMQNIWLDKALRQLSKNPGMDDVEIQSIIAAEMLAEDTRLPKLSAQSKGRLAVAVQRGKIRTQLNARLKSSPGCMLTATEIMGRDFANKTFKEAMRSMLYFDLAHEMGHSQGLTHNFIGSFDKANFGNEDGTPSKRNYSSIMDYYGPGQFNWDGLGSYDIHALRASHLGLLEVRDEAAKAKLGSSSLVNGKFVSIAKIQELFAKNGWNNFGKKDIAGILKPYKYCTDIHVGYEPTCQRFDNGSTATEIVSGLIKNYEDSYVLNHYAWDRNNFGFENIGRAMSSSMRTMNQMRQFMDELFYKAVTNTAAPGEMADYFQAALKAYVFYIQTIKTPDASAPFLSSERFIAVPFIYKELDKAGKETGKQIQDVEIVEKRALQNTILRDDRMETIGIEFEKIMAMNFLTMKGYPSYKYSMLNLEFSFLDFEKYMLGLETSQSAYVSTIASMMMNDLKPSFTNDHALLSELPDVEADVTSSMRAYAGIYSVLNLEATTLRDKDNFANLFKIGVTVGKAPSDRISLGQLGTSEKSKTRVRYWALDSADAAQNIMTIAAKKNFFIQNMTTLQPLMEKMILAHALALQAQAKDANGKVLDAKEDAAVKKEKAALLAKLTALNAKGDLITPQQEKETPELSLAAQVGGLLDYNEKIIQISIGLAFKPELAAKVVPGMLEQSTVLAKSLPLFAIDQKALVSSLGKLGEELSKQESLKVLGTLEQNVSAMTNGESLEVSYGLVMKNIEFLSSLTTMTNPEFSR